MKKNNIFKVLIIVIDIIAIVGLIFVAKNWLDKKRENNSVPTSEIQTVIYKNFTFEVTNDYEYIPMYDDLFGLGNNDYRGTIEFVINQDDYIFNDPAGYFDDLNSLEYNLSSFEKTNINDQEVLKFTSSSEENYTLYCFKLNDDYAVNIEINVWNEEMNSDEVMAEFMDILSKSNYDDSEEYHYKKFYPNN